MSQCPLAGTLAGSYAVGGVWLNSAAPSCSLIAATITTDSYIAGALGTSLPSLPAAATLRMPKLSYRFWNIASSVTLAPPPRLMLMTSAPPSRHLSAAAARLPPPQLPVSLKTLTMYSSAAPGSTPTTPRSLLTALIVPATWVPWPLPSVNQVPTLPSVVPFTVIPAKSL